MDVSFPFFLFLFVYIGNTVYYYIQTQYTIKFKE